MYPYILRQKLLKLPDFFHGLLLNIEGKHQPSKIFLRKYNIAIDNWKKMYKLFSNYPFVLLLTVEFDASTNT